MIKYVTLLKKIAIINLLCLSIISVNCTEKPIFRSEGVVKFDHVLWGGDTTDDLLPGAFLRNVDVFLSGNLDNKYLSYLIHFNTSISNYKKNLTQAYLNFNYNNIINIKVGQLTIPFNLEQINDVKHCMFMENALMESVIEPDFLGISIDLRSRFINFSMSLLMPEITSNTNKRTFSNSLKYNDVSLHLGLSYKFISKHPNHVEYFDSVVFKDHLAFNALASLLTTHVSIMPNYHLVGIEIAGFWKELYTQSEIFLVGGCWRDYDPEFYYSWYSQIAYSLTGEMREYNNLLGYFADPMPKNPFGSFEVVFRFNHTGLKNRCPLLMGVSICDGEKNAAVLGLNWFINDSLKFQLNCAYEDFKYRDLGQSDKKILGLGFRIQFSF